jgi:hypothetical protein
VDLAGRSHSDAEHPRQTLIELSVIEVQQLSEDLDVVEAEVEASMARDVPRIGDQRQVRLEHGFVRVAVLRSLDLSGVRAHRDEVGRRCVLHRLTLRDQRAGCRAERVRDALELVGGGGGVAALPPAKASWPDAGASGHDVDVETGLEPRRAQQRADSASWYARSITGIVSKRIHVGEIGRMR